MKWGYIRCTLHGSDAIFIWLSIGTHKTTFESIIYTTACDIPILNATTWATNILCVKQKVVCYQRWAVPVQSANSLCLL